MKDARIKYLQSRALVVVLKYFLLMRFDKSLNVFHLKEIDPFLGKDFRTFKEMYV
jgi:hypothetical protein